MDTTLLVANGDEQLADFFGRLCRDFGYEVETATNGVECLDQLHRTSTDVLILDQNLPDGGGESVLARMREECDLLTIPVILICESGVAVPTDLLGPPIRFHLRKPYRLTALLECIRAALTSDRHQSYPGRVLQASTVEQAAQ